MLTLERLRRFTAMIVSCVLLRGQHSMFNKTRFREAGNSQIVTSSVVMGYRRWMVGVACVLVMTMTGVYSAMVSGQTATPSLQCGEIIVSDEQVSIPIRVDFGGYSFDTVRMEMIFDENVLSNPTATIGNDFDTPGLDGAELDGLFVTVFGRSSLMSEVTGMAEYALITFDWTGAPTEITFNTEDTGSETPGTRGYIIGDPTPLEVSSCEVGDNGPEPTPTEELSDPVCTVSYELAAAWQGHVQANVTVQNNSSDPIEGWSLSWETAPYESFQSGWNANFSESGDILTASNDPSHWNGTLTENGGTATFGVTLESTESTLAQPNSFDLDGLVCENSSAPTTLPTTVPTPTDVATTVPTETATPQPTVTEDPNQTGGDCDVAYTQTQAWPGNFELSVTVTNNGSDPISGWDLVWELGAGEAFVSGWDATFATDGQTITASNPSWDNNISANGGSVSFGFQLTSDSDTLNLPTGFMLNGAVCSGGTLVTNPTPTTPPSGDADCTVTYAQTQAWPDHFEIAVTLTNNSATPVSDWVLAWELGANETYVHGWNAEFAQTGTQLTATSYAWNNELSANDGSVTLGFQLTSSDDTLHIPTAFDLNGVACSAQSPVEPTPVAPTPTPLPIGSDGACGVTYDPVTAWPGYVEVNMTILNHATTPIDGWELMWILRDSESYHHGWNAQFTQDGTLMTAQSYDWNAGIAADGGTVTFGLQLSTPDDVLQLPTEFMLNGELCEGDVSNEAMIAPQFSSVEIIPPDVPIAPAQSSETIPAEIEALISTIDLDTLDALSANAPEIVTITLITTTNVLFEGESTDIAIVLRNEGSQPSLPHTTKLSLSSGLDLLSTIYPAMDTVDGLYYAIPALAVDEELSWTITVQASEGSGAISEIVSLASAHRYHQSVSFTTSATTRSASSALNSGGIQAPERWAPNIIEPTIAEFSGAATYGYSFNAPAGRGGVGPQVGLSYSSLGLNGSNFHDSGDIAEGWSLSGIPFIYRSNLGLCNGTQYSNVKGAFRYGNEDEFQLNLNGSFELYKHDSLSDGGQQYDAEGAPGLFAQRRNSLFGDNGAPNETTDYWIVKTTDGTVYRFGYTESSEQVATYVYEGSHPTHCDNQADLYDGTGGEDGNGKLVTRYWLDRVHDVDGNVMVVNYRTVKTDEGRELAVYPEFIHYNNNQTIEYDDFNWEQPGSESGLATPDHAQQLNELNAKFESNVHLVWTKGSGGNSVHTHSATYQTNNSLITMAGKLRLNDVAVSHHGEQAWAYTLHHGRILQDYQDDPNENYQDSAKGGVQVKLTGIDKCYAEEGELDSDGLCGANDPQLPTVEFDYLRQTTGRNSYIFSGFDFTTGLPIYEPDRTVEYKSAYLHRVHNEYGGVHEFVYSDPIDIDTESSYDKNDYLSYFVEAIKIWDGYTDIYDEGDDPTSTIAYHYRLEDACYTYSTAYGYDPNGSVVVTYDGNQYGDRYCGDEGTVPQDTAHNNTEHDHSKRSLVGFSQVVVTVSDDQEGVQSIVHKQYSTAADPFLRGDIMREATYHNEASPDYISPADILAGTSTVVPPVETKYRYVVSSNQDVAEGDYLHWWCSKADLTTRSKCLGHVETNQYDTETGGKNSTYMWSLSPAIMVKTASGEYPRQMGVTQSQWTFASHGKFWHEVADGDERDSLLVRRQVTNYLAQPAPHSGWLVKPWRSQLIDGEGQVQSESFNLYDGYDDDDDKNDPDDQPLSYGRLTRRVTAEEVGNNGTPTRTFVNETFTYNPDKFWALEQSTTYPTAIAYGDTDEYGDIPEPTGIGQQSTITFDEIGLLIDTVENDLGHQTVVGYDVDRPWLVNNITSPNGAETQYVYDGMNRLTDVFAPDPDSGLPTYHSVKYEYQIAGVGTTETGVTLDTVQIKEIIAPNDPANEMTNLIFLDGLGRTRQTWSGMLDVNDATLAQRQMWVGSFGEFDVLGRSICQTSAITVTDTDLTLNRLRDCDGENADGSRLYDHTSVTFDSLGRTHQTIGIDESTVTHEYGITPDGFHYQTMIDPLSNQMRYENDALGRLRYVHEYELDNTLPYATTTYNYDALDRLISVVDAHSNSNTTTIGYDALGRKTEMSDPDMGEWTYRYDAMSNLIQQTDGNDQMLCFYYDQLNRMTEKHLLDHTLCPEDAPQSNADSLLAQYSYYEDKEDELYSRMLGLMAEESVPDVTAHEWVYDYRGRVTTDTVSIHNPVNTALVESFMAAYDYDDLNRQTTVTYPDGEVVTSTFNRQGGLKTITGVHLLKGINDSYVTNAFYNERGQMRGLDLGNGLITRHQYGSATNAYRMESTNTHMPGGSLIQQFAYDYDTVGNITTITDTHALVTDVNEPDVESFTYDSLYRLQTASATGVFEYNHETVPDLTYAYDEIGNITQYKGREYDYADTHSACDAPAQDLPHAVKQIENDYFCYDGNGNMVTRIEHDDDGTETVYEQQFDVENRLVGVMMEDENGSTSLQFTYNASGSRMATAKQSLNTQTVTYTPFPFYELEIESNTVDIPLSVTQRETIEAKSLPYTLVVGLILLVVVTAWYQRKSGKGNNRLTLTLLLGLIGMTLAPTPVLQAETTELSRIGRKTYFFGRSAIAQRVDVLFDTLGSMDETEEGLFYLHTNHLGSISVMTDETGEVVENSIVRFLPFGGYRERIDIGTTPETASPTDLGFTGHKQNDEIGLIYMNARYYSASIGKFISADIIIPNGQNPQAYNRFAYVFNNPLNLVDPSGHRPSWCGNIPDHQLPDECRPSTSAPPPNPTPTPVPTPSPEDADYQNFDTALSYMHSEMITNATGAMVQLMQIQNGSGLYGRAMAKATFATLVRAGGPWDHKPQLDRMLGLKADQHYWMPVRGSEYEYYYDIWSNIHYGYVGIAAGFGYHALLEWANPENAGAIVESFIGKSSHVDVVTMQIGMYLWYTYGDSLTEEQLHQAILDHEDQLLQAQELDRQEHLAEHGNEDDFNPPLWRRE